MSMDGQAWSGPLDPLDIVYCHFPEAGSLIPAPKPRPALVLNVNDGESPLHVQIAYGTSRKTLDKYSGEFTIGPDDGAVFIQTGLTVATKFDLARLVWLPYDSHWFKPRTGAGASKTPKLGYLDAGKTLSIRRRFEASGRAAGLI